MSMIQFAIARRNARKKAQALPTYHPPGSAPRNPIVLCHGLLGFDTLFGIVDYWKKIPEALRAAGAEVYVASVSGTASTETRAEELLRQISWQFPGRSVHLIGHSMGGLDCRYLVTHLRHLANFNVLSVTTVATPHWGSPVADVVEDKRIAKCLGIRLLMKVLPNGEGDGQAFASLSTWNTRNFNARTPNVPGVRYLSYGCQFIPGVIDTVAWGASFHHIYAKEGANDGLVSVGSAQWGEYLGTINGVNHTEIIGHKFTQTRPTDIHNLLTGQRPFDHKDFFLNHARFLATNVEMWA